MSAASICAKVIRDHRLSNWAREQSHAVDNQRFGSGYPGDAVTKRWLIDTLDPVFGFDSIVRFSWSTCGELLKKRGVPVQWRFHTGEDLDDDDDDEVPPSKRQRRTLPDLGRAKWFGDRGLNIVTDI